MQIDPINSKENLMQNAVAKTWRAIGTTGKLIIVLTLFFFIGKTLGKH